MGPPGALVSVFEAETGIRVTYVNMNGGTLQTRLYAEGGHPRWTLAWFVGDGAMAALDSAGLLARHSARDPDWPASARPPPPWIAQVHPLLPADGAWLPTALTLAGVFVTRTAPAPATWPALAAWPGPIGMVSPVTSGTAYPALTALIEAAGGPVAGHRLLRSIRTHGLEISNANPLLVAALAHGDITLAILPGEAAAAARDPALRVTIPRPAAIAPEVVAVSAQASPAARARAARFIRFLLTPRGQDLVMRSTAEGTAWPAIAGAAVPPSLPPLDTLTLTHPDPVEAGARQGAEIGWFRREITG